jgi:hypothetical protein
MKSWTGFTKKDQMIGGNVTEENKPRIRINKDEVAKIAKQYKKIKKYQKSSIHAIRKLQG